MSTSVVKEKNISVLVKSETDKWKIRSLLPSLHNVIFNFSLQFQLNFTDSLQKTFTSMLSIVYFYGNTEKIIDTRHTDLTFNCFLLALTCSRHLFIN